MRLARLLYGSGGTVVPCPGVPDRWDCRCTPALGVSVVIRRQPKTAGLKRRRQYSIMTSIETARLEVLDWIAKALELPIEQIDLNKPLAEIGIDSLDAVHTIATIESIIRKELPEDVIQRVNCLNDILDMMQEKMAAA